MPSMLLTRRLGAFACISLLLAACGTPSPSPSVPAPRSPVATAAPQSPLQSTTEAAGSPGVEPSPPIAAEPPPLALEEVAGGLSAPINITPTPDGWLLVNERGGRVVAVDPETGATSLVVDLSDRIRAGGEQGLLGLALHPDWPATARAFVDYTDRNGDTVVSELQATDLPAPPRLDPSTERVLLQVDQPYDNHNGGQLAFGPDGYLYISLGDGGAGGDPHGNGQDPSTLLGSILRIDIEAPDDTPDADSLPYGIPADNPFGSDDAARPEVFLYGLRNPWRFSFDRATDEMWIGDVGQNAYEEIDRLNPATDGGANLGWNVMEGLHCYAGEGCSSDGLVLPVTEYGRDLGCSVTGGFVYRGEAIEGLTGWYLFSDYCSGLLFGIPSDAEPPAAGEAVELRRLLETGLGVSTFGQRTDGELYLADINGGRIYRIVAGG